MCDVRDLVGKPNAWGKRASKIRWRQRDQNAQGLECLPRGIGCPRFDVRTSLVILEQKGGVFTVMIPEDEYDSIIKNGVGTSSRRSSLEFVS